MYMYICMYVCMYVYILFFTYISKAKIGAYRIEAKSTICRSAGCQEELARKHAHAAFNGKETSAHTNGNLGEYA